MAGVEEQVRIPGSADDRHAVRRGRAKARPELRIGGIAAAGKQLQGFAENEPAPNFADRIVVSGEFGGPGGAQAVSQSAVDHFELVVDEADHGRDALIGHRKGDRIALRRINRQTYSQRLQQQRRVASQRHHEGIAIQSTAVGFDALDPPGGGDRFSDPHPVSKNDPETGADLRQPDGERVGVPAFVVGAEDTADEVVPDPGQRRFETDARVGIDDAADAAQAVHQLDLRKGLPVVARVSKDVQDTAGQRVVLDPGVRSELGEFAAAVEGEAKGALDVDSHPAMGAVGEEAQAPRPQGRIGAQVEQQRRIGAAQPLQRLPRRRRRRPRRHMIGRNLPAVGEAGFQPRPRLTVDHRDLVPVADQVIGGSDADDAGPEDRHSHVPISDRGSMPAAV